MLPVFLTSTGVVCHAGRGLEALTGYLREPQPQPRLFQADEIAPALSLPYLWAPVAIERERSQVLAEMALTDALDGFSGARRRRMSLFLASSNVDLLDRESDYAGRVKQGDADAVAFMHPGAGLLAERLARDFGLGGGAFTINTACASGANALLYAHAAIAQGHTKEAVVLGIETPSRITLSGLHGLSVLGEGPCCPFDRRRHHMLLGEAACALVLGAEAAGEPIRLAGGASACDIAAGPTLTRPQAAREVMEVALKDRACELVAIKTHGTGTPGNDAAEAQALAALALGAPATSLKSALGHTLGACGVLETAAMAACWAQGFLPATHGFEQADPGLSIMPETASRPLKPGVMLLNYFGFGGNNCALVLETST